MTTPATHLNLRRTEAGTLAFSDAAGVLHENVLPVRLFPLTDPTHWVAITSADGQELGQIKDLDDLPPEVRQLLLESLAHRDFVPVIQAIHAIRRAAHGYEWYVTTNRGKTHFNAENDESIQALSGGSIVVVDQRNTRYLIPDPMVLDAKSRNKLERYY
jgi:hypothetical protein